MLQILGKESSVLNDFVAQLRDSIIQKDSLRFRYNLRRVGEVMAYEISKTIAAKEICVETPLGEARVSVPAREVVLAAILRSGLPMHQGFLNYFDKSESAFISAYRHYRKDGSFRIEIESLTSPSLTGKTLIIIDPMLATGISFETSYTELVRTAGEPDHVHIATVIASDDGVEYLRKHFPSKQLTVWTVAVDEELTVKSYIVPGIGDTGDLAFGEKI